MKKDWINVDSTNVEQIINKLNSIHRATIITIESITEPVMLKTDNPYFGKILKFARINGLICNNYESNVNKARIKEHKNPDFIAKDRPWGIKINKTPIVFHNNEVYLSFRPLRYLFISFIWKNTLNSISSNDYKLLQSFLREDKSYSHQGLFPPGILERSYKLSNIKRIKV